MTERHVHDFVISGPTDLQKLDQWELAEVARVREIAYQDALGEIERRRAERGIPKWDEKSVAAALSLKREGKEPPLRVRVNDLPPALFRMGYEWATLSIVAVLEGVLACASDDAVMISEYEITRNGWMKDTGKRTFYDPRRRAAHDLIDTIKGYVEMRQQGMLVTLAPRKSSYHPNQDQQFVAERYTTQGSREPPIAVLSASAEHRDAESKEG